MNYLPWYLAAVNLLGFAFGGYDKRAAKTKKQRIPEKTLFLISLLGGSLGFYCAMQLFRHKTKHWYFAVFIPLIMLAQTGLLIWLYFFR